MSDAILQPPLSGDRRKIAELYQNSQHFENAVRDGSGVSLC
jgi:hypothetical protein